MHHPAGHEIIIIMISSSFIDYPLNINCIHSSFKKLIIPMYSLLKCSHYFNAHHPSLYLLEEVVILDSNPTIDLLVIGLGEEKTILSTARG